MAAERSRVINAAQGSHGTLYFDISWKIFCQTTVRELGFEECSLCKRQQSILQQQCLFLLIPILGIFHVLHHKEIKVN